MDAITLKTIKELQSISSIMDDDYLVINQPNVNNVQTGHQGVTGKVTVAQLSEQVKVSQSLITQSEANMISRQMPEPFLIAQSKTQLLIKEGTVLRAPDGNFFNAQQDLDLNFSSSLDIGSIVNGTDYYLYYYRTQGGQNVFVISTSKIAPDGLSQLNTIRVGGFHTLCNAAGTGMTYQEGGETKNHWLNGFGTSDILPNTVWCLNHRPFSEPEGMSYISSLDFWADIYKQSGSGFNTKSVYKGAITRSRQYVDFIEDQICVKKELLDDAEFAAAMMGSNEKTAVQGASEAGATTGGAGGRVDTAGRRMISIYGLEEGCGALWELLRTTSAAGVVGSISGQTSAPGAALAYGWLDLVKTGTGTNTQGTAYGPLPQSGDKGSFWGLAGALLAGGSWSDGAGCGSRARRASIARSRALATYGGRGRSRPKRF